MWSSEQPTQKTFWWLHDLHVYSLENYSVDNTIQTQWHAPAADTYEVYVKALSSWAGGAVRININDETFQRTIMTKRAIDPLSHLLVEPYQYLMYRERGLASRNDFLWLPVGSVELDAGVHEIALTNNTGFNAVSEMVIIPRNQLARQRAESEISVAEGYQYITFEGESDFDIYNAHVQSATTTPAFSNGRALYLNEGQMERSFEIASPGLHTLSIYTDSLLSSDTATIDVFITDDTNEPVHIINNALTKKQGTSSVITVPDIELKAEQYTLTLHLADTGPSLVEETDMHLFDYDEIIDVYNFFPFDVGRDCCFCEPLLPSDVQIAYVPNEVGITIAQGNACEWAIVSSNLVPVEPGQEWLMTFDLRADQAKHNHVKLFFMDEDRVIRDVKYITELQSGFSYDWNTIQTIFDVPPGVAYVQLHLWARKNPVAIGSFDMRDVVFKNYRTLPHVDVVTVRESTPPTSMESQPILGTLHGVERRLEVATTTKAAGVLLYETYQPLWKLKIPADVQSVPLFGMLQGYVFADPVDVDSFVYSIRTHQIAFYIGLGFLIVLCSTLGYRLYRMYSLRVRVIKSRESNL